MSRTFLKKEMKAFYLKVYRKFKICIQHLFFFLTFNITTYVCDIIKKNHRKRRTHETMPAMILKRPQIL